MGQHLATMGRAHTQSAGEGRGQPAPVSWPLVEGRVLTVGGQVYAEVAGRRRGPLRGPHTAPGAAQPPAGAVGLVGIVPDGRDWLVSVDGWSPP